MDKQKCPGNPPVNLTLTVPGPLEMDSLDLDKLGPALTSLGHANLTLQGRPGTPRGRQEEGMLASKILQNPEKNKKIGYQDAGGSDVQFYWIFDLKMTAQNTANSKILIRKLIVFSLQAVLT